MTDDPPQKLSDLGGEGVGPRARHAGDVPLRPEPQAGFVTGDSARLDDIEPSMRNAPKLTPAQVAAKMRAMYDPENAIDASAWLGKIRRDE